VTPAPDVLQGRIVVRRARTADVLQIAALVEEWAAEALLLPRSASEIAVAIDDYVVAVDLRGRVLACGALRQYSPSLAELVSLAVARSAHGRGLGRLVVAQIERLALQRGYASLFAHTVNTEFFSAVGYVGVDREAYPEKVARTHTACVVRSLVAEPERLSIAA
jgi:amino-acid N-acetyltransferase